MSSQLAGTAHLKHPDAHVPWSQWSEEQTLCVVIPYSNPFRWRTRRELVNDAIRHLGALPNIHLVVVELAYGDRPFEVTGGRDTDVQLRTSGELWHKEQLINLGVQRFPAGWKYGAYVDGDFHFSRYDLALETIHQLQHHDFVQMFSSYADLTGETYGTGQRPLRTNNGFAYNYVQRGYQPPTGFSSGGWKTKAVADGYYSAMMQSASRGVGATGGAWAWRRSSYDTAAGMRSSLSTSSRRQPTCGGIGRAYIS